jgi:hypothetical protein
MNTASPWSSPAFAILGIDFSQFDSNRQKIDEKESLLTLFVLRLGK